MAEGLFEIYREHLSKQGLQYLKNEGEVVLKAADWNQFIDPKSKLALVSTDLENLGVRKDFTRQRIVLCLKNVLEGDRIPYMPLWTHNCIQASEFDDRVVNFGRVKRQASEQARKAILQVIDFCGGEKVLEEEEKRPEERPEEKPLSWKERFWDWFFRKLYKVDR